MTSFRKKPVVIQAMQYDGTRASIDAICRWANDPQDRTEDPIVTYLFTGEHDVFDVLIGTLEGDMSASVGDWIIRGIKGEFYPCKPDIFEATYEMATDLTSDAPAPASGAASDRPTTPSPS